MRLGNWEEVGVIYVSAERFTRSNSPDYESEGACCRSECGQGGLAGDSECQSDLQRACRSEFAAAFEKAKMTAHLGSHEDETGRMRSGTFLRRIFWSRGRMRGLMTERFRLCSR
jgi:hypothetical protein